MTYKRSFCIKEGVSIVILCGQIPSQQESTPSRYYLVIATDLSSQEIRCSRCCCISYRKAAVGARAAERRLLHIKSMSKTLIACTTVTRIIHALCSISLAAPPTQDHSAYTLFLYKTTSCTSSFNFVIQSRGYCMLF